ncbi:MULTISPECIES: helix-turn-helix domain-containing protein [Paraburkholderia]|uniref:Helix-turn-helix domain-containing protein n=1 Tax=Paraburkholderia dipogonis TaxID=1211383 RepID=A0A4Y8MGS4_9BURK|nr:MULTISPECIES: helix-turn-helix domain-containing protein [Paraburkholderia]TFE36641.1 helix-turn-helix domain-containing protein [Paraburkholderia dipogonis]
MTGPEERKTLTSLISEATLAGARQAHACNMLGLSSARTVQRWQRGKPDAADGRSLRHHEACHKLSADERAELQVVANSAEFGHLPPGQIASRLADQQRYLASESTFYRILKAEKQLAHRRSERPATLAANRIPFTPTRRTSCIPGISRICRRRSVGSTFIYTCFWMYSVTQDRRLTDLCGGKQRAGQRGSQGPLRA